ncbi:hypothetical protein DHEL01_v210384 [Diaporthe helianthi]|uniref:F-box domain-containing protein n=1 Tax=Diaporthe helianthi TaxID=158607 RepID=A0A2P5HLU6_DIAHE|nr:hypothetical protein DHEL01_v210384 [Diaporthe helianthi]
MADNSYTTPGSTREPRATRQARLTHNTRENADAIFTALHYGPRTDPGGTLGTAICTLPRQAATRKQRAAGGAPPTYDELYPPSPAPASRRRLGTHPSPPQGMDPLVAAMWHNKNLSLLHSLPDRLVLKIISMLNNSGVECLRRVARRFPPLCVREVLSPLRGNNPKLSETGPLNWPKFGVSSPAQHRPRFLGLIDRDECCSGCLVARRSPRWEQRLHKLTEYIHCSACGLDHPACLFSATQRLKPARFRYCIAHEGFMRVCQHDGGAISLSHLSGLRSASDNRRRYPWHRKEDVFRTVICSDKSHIIPCGKAEGGAFPESSGTCGSRNGLCVGFRRPRILVDCNIPYSYGVAWAAHVPFDGQMITLRPRLSETYENVGKHIVPSSVTAMELPPLRCFDPNDCHCTTFAGSENVRWEWECEPWLSGRTECMSDSYKGLDSLRPPTTSGSTIRNILRWLKKQAPKECAADQKRHLSRSDSWVPFNRGVGRARIDVRPCHAGKDCTKVDYERSFLTHYKGKIAPQWYNTLDPESYNITEDEDGHRIVWCQTAGCRNYYKGILNYAGILRHRDFHKKCRHPNCQ